MKDSERISAFGKYLADQLDELLRKHSVVVFFDPRGEFLPFFERDLKCTNSSDEIRVARIKGRDVSVARFAGSFFGLRAAVEPIVGIDKPGPLIVYLPCVTRDRRFSVLMELEKGGTCYEPQLKRLALNVLRKRFTDGQIDEMLRPASVGYDDVVAFLCQGEEGRTASVLRSIFDGAQSEQLLTLWLADTNKDSVITGRDAASELFKLIDTRLGFAVPSGASITDARDRTLRYVLVNEFRSDLSCEPPASVSMVPSPQTKDQLGRVHDLAQRLRRAHADRYVEIANGIESSLNLQAANVPAAGLGNIDTFAFEERALLAHAGGLLARREYSAALGVVGDRSHSFWVDRDVARQAQWETCRRMAELGREIEMVRPLLAKTGSDPTRWVNGYAAEDGWFRVDSLQRRLETWVARMEDEPETERALAVVRREHEELLKGMAEGFAEALGASGYTVLGALHQTRIYPDVVQSMGGRVAYFFVDAMRFEMGVELARELDGARELTIRPAIAALPSITPVGMAALLPGASASFSVVDQKGELAARIEGTAMPGLSERIRFLKAKGAGCGRTDAGQATQHTAFKIAQEPRRMHH